MPFDSGSAGRQGGAEAGTLRDTAVKAREQSMALYATAASVLAGVESRRGSIKGLVYASSFQVAGFGVRAGEGREGSPGGGSLPQPVSSRPRAEREAAVRAGVRDPALLLRAGRRDHQRRPPPRGEETAAAPGQGSGAGGAGRGWAVSPLRTWSPRGTVHGVTSASRPSEMRMSTL